MRERLALSLHKIAWRLINLSDWLLEVPDDWKRSTPSLRPPSLYDTEPFPAEMDNADPRNWGESPQ